MITRELDRNRTILIEQEDHADLAAQFASHWGNESFSRLDPYNTVVLATQYHDSHFRELEADLPVDVDAGYPLGHRRLNAPLKGLQAVRDNVAWVAKRNLYASVLISKHNTGLQQNRYGIIHSWQDGYGARPRVRTLSAEVAAMVYELEENQNNSTKHLSKSDPDMEKKILHNYHLLQVFDLLSLYFCCDAYKDGEMQSVRLGPVPLGFESTQQVELSVVALGQNIIQFEPYPFDINPLEVSVVCREMSNVVGSTEDECRAAFFRAPRGMLSWTVTQ